MRQTNFKVPRIAAATILLAASLPDCSIAQQPGQKTFSSPQDASTALAAAAQVNDEKAVLEILGPDGKEIISSGDPTADAQSRADFVRRYQEMHRLVKEPDGFTLYIGAENWPVPIPVVERDRAWYFDTAAGKREILYRRIGRNEISTISVCQGLVAAQKEHYSTQHEYAPENLQRCRAAQRSVLGSGRWRIPEPHWATHRVRRGRGLRQTPGRRSGSLPRLLLPDPYPSGEK